jgi:hypothetical protein
MQQDGFELGRVWVDGVSNLAPSPFRLKMQQQKLLPILEKKD